MTKPCVDGSWPADEQAASRSGERMENEMLGERPISSPRLRRAAELRLLARVLAAIVHNLPSQ